jgi:hypothetical protein
MRLIVPFVAAVMVLVMAVSRVPLLFQPSTLALGEAVRELGPVAGWRCVFLATYVYDPSAEAPDSTLLEEAPETRLSQTVRGVKIERVEASLRGSDAVLWTTVDQQPRVYVLSPGSQQAIGRGIEGRAQTCFAHQRAWNIVAEHGLQ